MKEINEQEQKLIVNKYRQILRWSGIEAPEKRKLIRKAFNLASKAHEGMRRKSGEPYILHPLEVALIATKEIGLRTTSIVAALLHDVVEDTDYTLKDIEYMFGKKVANIIDGLTKISGIYEQTTTAQAESIRKILLTLSEDVRVILIKLADRLHNMRTLDSMPLEKRMKISSETEYMYAPLAHRLGLNSIKSELEDLVLKYKHPEAYNFISTKIKDDEDERLKFINKFISPIKTQLKKYTKNFSIIYRYKSKSSIWHKMQEKGVIMEDIYDLFAVRIIIDSPLDQEKADCWHAYSVITDLYVPKLDRFRDWISVPKANGYESLHTTVMSKDGRWVEVQIRSKRMDEIAEKGYAAHFKYKEKGQSDSGLDDWLLKIRELIQTPHSDTLDFLDEFKLNLFSHEIYAFTPSGEMKSLPKGATVLDFAYAIHSEIGNHCIGAKVNNQLSSLNFNLNSGDQIEILTSARQNPEDDWLNWVVTARAKSQIKQAVKEKKKNHNDEGKTVLAEYMLKLKKEMSPANVKKLLHYFKIKSELDFYYNISTNKITFEAIEQYFLEETSSSNKWMSRFNFFSRKAKNAESLENIVTKTVHQNPENYLLNKNTSDLNYKIADCCNPIPGDDVIGFVKDGNTILIHRTSCKLATKLMSTYGKGIVKAKWRDKEKVEFLTGIHLEGIDKVGLVAEITNILSSDMNVNLRSINIEASDGLFFGQAMLYVNDTAQLDRIISELRKIKSLKTINRIA